jgi:hypothetical protein
LGSDLAFINEKKNSLTGQRLGDAADAMMIVGGHRGFGDEVAGAEAWPRGEVAVVLSQLIQDAGSRAFDGGA